MRLCSACVVALILSLILFGCRQKIEKTGGNQEWVPQDITAAARAYADSMLTVLTLEQRVGQTLMPSIFALSDTTTLTLLKTYIEDYHVGGIVLLKGDSESALILSREAAKSQVPLFVAIDAEWGLGMRLEDASNYPKNGELEDANEKMMYDYGRKIAQESRDLGINMILGPVVDILSVEGNIIGKRSFGKNPGIVSEYGVAYAKGLESGGVMSVAKHFPGHGGSKIDSHKGPAKIDRPISSLDSTDLRPFREYVESGLSGVMAGHIQSPALDPDGNPASVSIDMLTALLREEMGFKGLILTDAFDMKGAGGFSVADALNAGADIILCPEYIRADYQSLLEGVKKGNPDLKVINERCRRILFYKYIFFQGIN